jgi:hypothetical protein
MYLRNLREELTVGERNKGQLFVTGKFFSPVVYVRNASRMYDEVSLVVVCTKQIIITIISTVVERIP